jgi:hypothetical protein
MGFLRALIRTEFSILTNITEMTFQTENKGLPVPDDDQEAWDDEVQQCFIQIDTYLKDISETSLEKASADLDSLGVGSSIKIDDNGNLVIGTDGDLSIVYQASSNISTVTDTQSGDVLWTYPHGTSSGPIVSDRNIEMKDGPVASESYADVAANQAVSGSISPSSVSTPSLNGITFLTNDMDEATVRSTVANASPNSVLIIEPGAQWTLTDTLTIPPRVQLYGGANIENAETKYTFIKGFNGPLATIQNFTAMRGVTFHGNKTTYTGDGIVVQDTPLITLSRIRIDRCAGNGITFNTPIYFSYFTQVYLFANGGWGVHYPPLSSSHYSQNLFNRCNFGQNDAGGILYEDNEHTTKYNNCTFASNSGPAINISGAVDNVVFTNTNFTSNDGPVLVANATANGITFADCNLAHNVEQPDSALTTPVGQIHLESSRTDIEIRGGRAFGVPYLYTATSNAGNHNCTISGTGRNMIDGDIDGVNTYLTVLNRSCLSGTITVTSGIGINPNGGGTIENYGPYA